MKTKKIYILAVLVLSLAQANTMLSQEFAPIGAKWHYTKKICPGLGNCVEDNFMTIESVGDTLINNKLCSILVKSDYTTCSDQQDTSFVYFENNRVYWYVKFIDEFTVLYDFNLEAGDSWQMISEIPNADTCLTMVYVDSVSFVNINDEQLKVMHISGPWLGYQGQIIERFGHNEYLFPWPFTCMIGDTLAVDCFGDLITDLRCYQDDGFGFFQRWDSIACDAIIPTVGVSEIGYSNRQFSVYPTISHNYVSIESHHPLPFHYKIFSSLGDLVKQGEIRTPQKITVIDIQNMSSGMYLLVVYNDNGRNVFRLFKN